MIDLHFSQKHAHITFYKDMWNLVISSMSVKNAGSSIYFDIIDAQKWSLLSVNRYHGGWLHLLYSCCRLVVAITFLVLYPYLSSYPKATQSGSRLISGVAGIYKAPRIVKPLKEEYNNEK